MKKIVIVLTMLVTVIVISAEEKEYQYGLGFGGGMISGSGFSFRKLNDNGGFQVNFGLMKYDHFGNRNIGVNLFKTMHCSKRSKLYVLGGAALYNTYEDDNWYDDYYDDNSNTAITVGGGFGFDYKLSEYIRFNFEWPVTFFFSTGNTNIYMYIPQAGIHYYFK